MRSQQACILLDALNESPVETVQRELAREDVLNVLEEIRGWQLPGQRLLVTRRDRDAPDIRTNLV